MLEKTIRTYYNEIFLYCYHRVGNRAVAEDLCQDTFVSFIEHYEEYRHIGKTKNYLYTIAGNKCKDFYRKNVSIPMEERWNRLAIWGDTVWSGGHCGRRFFCISCTMAYHTWGEKQRK